MSRYYKIVTTFHKKGYDEYGFRFIDTMEKYLPDNMSVDIYLEGFSIDKKYNKINFLNYKTYCGEQQAQLVETELTYVKRRQELEHEESVKRKKKMHNGFRWDASRFAHKVFSLQSANNELEKMQGDRSLVWIDGDVIACKQIPNNWFDTLMDKKMYWSRVNRGPKQYPECGFMMFNCNHKHHQEYWNIMYDMYNNGKMFELYEWHDSYVFWQAEKMLEKKYERIGFDLGDNRSGHAFVRGKLGEYLDHTKGKRKELGYSPERKQK
jgi:hypothetical protein